MKQKLTVVDENDNVIGEDRYTNVYEKGLIHRLIRVLLINDKNQILLQWRSANEDTFPETWDQSAGGHVDAGEDYETAAYRELKEELGIDNVKLELIDKFYTAGEIGWKKINRFNGIFIAKYNGVNFTLQEEEVEKAEWFDIDELYKKIETNPDDFTHGLIHILKEYKDEILRFTK
ncbi:NUDIX domain-containing protein [Candidatus Dojkabacteria bacterium]|uniref:NUDIX domain-containing protein n=1 Tax=Candidatus Dojkabacteria bacterium TaxID=2099670 RepID=A0A955RLQ1_9BACT|nr:NUDIX domain-containing protein [Candidatus Dojkabacteria bacterium]